MQLHKFLTPLFIIAVCMVACKKQDYTDGGTIVSPQVNVTTYDYLKNNDAHLFDTVLLLIDKAGMQAAINEKNITFFSPTNASIRIYLAQRVAEEFSLDPTHTWTLDSMIAYELPVFTAAINRLIVKQPLPYETLTEDGTLYQTADTAAQCIVSYEQTQEGGLGYNGIVSNPLFIEYYYQVLQPITPPFVASELSGDQAVRFRVQTSGIQSTTGLLNVLKDDNKNTSIFLK